MKRPTLKKNYTKEELKKYAEWRKKQELKDKKPREPLAITSLQEVTIELSTGGDADGFKIWFDKDGDIVRGVYYWADWGVSEEVELEDREIDEIANRYNLDLLV